MDPGFKLFMVLLGCRPKGRLTEQHDVFFGIAEDLKGLREQMLSFWPASGGLHIDAWREVTQVRGYEIGVQVKPCSHAASNLNLFFINLGGYRDDDFEEYHHKFLTVNPDLASAVKESKKTAFFKEAFIDAPGGVSHLDDKYGFDVDEIYNVAEILAPELKDRFCLQIRKSEKSSEDILHIGYLPFSKLK
jgi:hypothetical protein